MYSHIFETIKPTTDLLAIPHTGIFQRNSIKKKPLHSTPTYRKQELPMTAMFVNVFGRNEQFL